MSKIIVKINTVATDESAHGRVQITKPDKTREWFHFRSMRGWAEFYELWARLEKPFLLNFDVRTGRFSKVSK